MPKASKSAASETVAEEGFEGHMQQLDGGYTVSFETYAADADLGPFFDGLPNNQCQAPHWGYVVTGKVKYSYGDREETFEAGDAYYAPPGHTPTIYAGTELIEFSPTDELQKTIEVVTKNMEAAGS